MGADAPIPPNRMNSAAPEGASCAAVQVPVNLFDLLKEALDKATG